MGKVNLTKISWTFSSVNSLNNSIVEIYSSEEYSANGISAFLNLEIKFLSLSNRKPSYKTRLAPEAVSSMTPVVP